MLHTDARGRPSRGLWCLTACVLRPPLVEVCHPQLLGLESDMATSHGEARLPRPPSTTTTTTTMGPRAREVRCARQAPQLGSLSLVSDVWEVHTDKILSGECVPLSCTLARGHNSCGGR
jgi:hypothetical protein